MQQWDDEENFIAEGAPGSNQLVESQEDEDFESKSEAPATLKSELSRQADNEQDEDGDAKSMHSNQLSEASQIIAPKRRGKQGQLSGESSQASQVKRE